ncbi:MAG TPA: DUF1223 domain-containing protein [Caulobacteraceae bacterium]|nr:DUF1223 domain-containing protein [Caulobacteraceae bacterium]
MRLYALIISAWLMLAAPAMAKAPVLVELFTSQGCAACVDANAYAAALASRDDVLPLTFSVGYQDYLGWRDTFAKPEFGERQKAYARRLTGRPVYTPQLIIDGRAQASGMRQGQAERLIDQAARLSKASPSVRRQGGKVVIGSGARLKGGADVWLIRYDPRSREVEVGKGENKGKVIAYRNVVRDLQKLGTWNGKAKAFKLPDDKDDGLRSAVIVQQAGGGRVLALWAD